MEMSWFSFRIGVLLGLSLACLSLAFPQTNYPQQVALFQRPQAPQRPSYGIQQQQQAPRPVNTVTVICRSDSLEVVIAADMFSVGAPVDNQELHLGVENSEFCRAEASSPEEYRIVVGLDDCGTKHWVTSSPFCLFYFFLNVYKNFCI